MKTFKRPWSSLGLAAMAAVMLSMSSAAAPSIVNSAPSVQTVQSAPDDVGWTSYMIMNMDPAANQSYALDLDQHYAMASMTANLDNVNVVAASGLYQLECNSWNTNGANAPNFIQVNCTSNLIGPAELSARTVLPQPVRLVGYWPRE